MTSDWKNELAMVARMEKVRILSSFFKTGVGEYAEGDVFIGVTVPDNRAVAVKYADAPIELLAEMLRSPIHEHRLSALLAMVRSYERSRSEERRADILSLYLANIERCNNWDLVDLSAPRIIGRELANGRCTAEHEALSQSGLLWARRVAVVATLWLVQKHHRTAEALEQCHLHIADSEPLMHKAVGWVLREVGKKDLDAMRSFLAQHITKITATSLSYATEKLSSEERLDWRTRRKQAH